MWKPTNCTSLYLVMYSVCRCTCMYNVHAECTVSCTCTLTQIWPIACRSFQSSDILFLLVSGNGESWNISLHGYELICDANQEGSLAQTKGKWGIYFFRTCIGEDKSGCRVSRYPLVWGKQFVNLCEFMNLP